MLGPDSKERFRDYNIVDLGLPLELLKTVMRTHINDRYDDTNVKVDGKRNTFFNIKMMREESLHMYYCRCKQQVYRTCLVDEGHEDPDNKLHY